jgi:DNA-binding transcriptional regulator YdaS (Cro superfamily)
VTTALDKAAELLGGQSELALALDVTSMAISQWKKRGVPAERAVQIEQVTKKKVKRSDLRPDLFGRALEARA